MTAFTAATLAAFIAAHGCLPPKAAPLFLDVAQGESGLIDTAINDNTAGRSYYPATTAEAVHLASSLIAQGHIIAAGIAQIRSTNWAWTGLSAESVFDPCRNLAAGLKVFLAAYGGATHPATQTAYSDAVLSRLARGTSIQAGGGAETPAAAPPRCAPGWDAWALAACSGRPMPSISSHLADGASSVIASSSEENPHGK